MSTAAVPHAGRRAVLLAGILSALIATASNCDVGCEPGNPNDWHRTAPTDSAAAAAMAAADRSPTRHAPRKHAGSGTTPDLPTPTPG